MKYDVSLTLRFEAQSEEEAIQLADRALRTGGLHGHTLTCAIPDPSEKVIAHCQTGNHPFLPFTPTS